MAVTRDATSAGGTTTGAACTVSHTIGTAGATTVVFAFVAISVSSNSTSTTCTATYGGTAMTQHVLTLLGSSTNRSAYAIFYLFNPASGAQNCVVTPGGASTKAGVRVSTVSYTGVAATGVGTAQTAAALTISATSVTNGYNIFGHINGVTMSTPSQSQRVLLGSAVSGVGDFLLVQDAAGTGSNITFSVSGTATTPSTFGVALTPYVPPVKMETLTDDFATQNAAKWNGFSGTNVQVTGGQLSIVPDSTFTRQVVSVDLFDLSSSYALIQETGLGSAQILSLAVDDTTFANRFELFYNFGDLIFRETVATVTDDTTITFNATDHAWWRIRESGGTVFWDTSPDGSAWTNRRSKTWAIPQVTSLSVFITAYTSAGTTAATLDNFNNPPAPAAPSLKTYNGQLTVAVRRAGLY